MCICVCVADVVVGVCCVVDACVSAFVVQNKVGWACGIASVGMFAREHVGDILGALHANDRGA